MSYGPDYTDAVNRGPDEEYETYCCLGCGYDWGHSVPDYPLLDAAEGWWIDEQGVVFNCPHCKDHTDLYLEENTPC